MKEIKSVALAVLMFIATPVIDPSADRVAPYLLGIIAVGLAALLVAGRPFPGLLGVVLALMLADKAVTAWIAFRGRDLPPIRPRKE